MTDDIDDLRNTTIIPIAPFKGFDDDDLPVEVVALAQQPDDVRFVAIKNREGVLSTLILNDVFTSPFTPAGVSV